jgi:hypothetical protein
MDRHTYSCIYSFIYLFTDTGARLYRDTKQITELNDVYEQAFCSMNLFVYFIYLVILFICLFIYFTIYLFILFYLFAYFIYLFILLFICLFYLFIY